MEPDPQGRLSLLALIAMVVGSMVGAGIFSLPRTFGIATGPFGALIAWSIAGFGMYTLARVFQVLAERKPELDAGIYAYAKAGFGAYPGFLAAFGYWLVGCIADVSYWVLIKSTLGGFFPIFGNGDTVPAVFLSSVGLWLFHFFILRGIKGATAVNTVVTFAKIVPIVVFIIILVGAARADLFRANFWGGEGMPEASLFAQIRATMLVTVFVFIGIEGASVYSRHARRRSDVGVATIMGFAGVLALMVLVTLLPYAVLARTDIAAARQPSMASVLEAVVGPPATALMFLPITPPSPSTCCFSTARIFALYRSRSTRANCGVSPLARRNRVCGSARQSQGNGPDMWFFVIKIRASLIYWPRRTETPAPSRWNRSPLRRPVPRQTRVL